MTYRKGLSALCALAAVSLTSVSHAQEVRCAVRAWPAYLYICNPDDPNCRLSTIIGTYDEGDPFRYIWKEEDYYYVVHVGEGKSDAGYMHYSDLSCEFNNNN